MTILERIASDVQLMFRRPPRQQYAALCYRIRKKQGLEVLLLTSRDTGRWVIPKGWPMQGKKSHAVAEREAYEEAGVVGNAEKEPIGFYTYLKGMDDGVKIPCKVQVHVLCVKENLKQFPEKGSRILEWVTCTEAAIRVNEPELKALFSKFEKRMQISGSEKQGLIALEDENSAA